MGYYHKRVVAGEFEAIVSRVRERLADEGFGVLCDIDVRAKFEEKLDLADYRRYRILGACNPALARDGLDSEIDLGVLLPCNIVVYEDDEGQVVVSAVDPQVMLSVVDDPALSEIASDVSDRFDRILESLATEPEATN